MMALALRMINDLECVGFFSGNSGEKTGEKITAFALPPYAPDRPCCQTSVIRIALGAMKAGYNGLCTPDTDLFIRVALEGNWPLTFGRFYPAWDPLELPARDAPEALPMSCFLSRCWFEPGPS